MLRSRVRFNAENKFEFQDDHDLRRGVLGDDSAQNTVNISHLISVGRRQIVPFLACCLIALALAAFYVTTATPLYTASANLIIDNRQVRSVQELSPLSDSPSLDTAAVESQAEVLRSAQVGLAVIDQLKLDQNPFFDNPPPSWMDMLLAKLGLRGGQDASFADERQRMILKALDRNLTVTRVGRTFVLQVDYTSPDPHLSAQIANAYTNAYLLEQVNSRIEEAQRARNWLKQRTEELRQLSVDTDLAAQKFRADHNLLATKGTLVSEQELGEMATQFVTAQAATAQAQARYLRIKKIIDDHQTDSAVIESLNNPVVSDLWTKYFDAARHMAEFQRMLGSDHSAVVKQKNSMEELKSLLFQQLGTIAQTYRTDYEVAAGREKALSDHLKQQKGISVTANDDQAQLRQLEQKAESYKLIYQTYLQRYQEAAQQELFPMTEAHVITAASPPTEPSRPRKPIVLAFSILLGAAAGAGFGMFRELMDRVFRTMEQVRDELGVEVLGMLPLISYPSLPQPSDKRSNAAENRAPAIGAIAPTLRYSIDHPFSAYAETLRSAKVAADVSLPGRATKIIGLVSLLPNEGKSTVAKNFASLLALQGARTLLVDADTRNRGLTRGIGCETVKVLKPEHPSRLTDLLRVRAG